MAMATKLSLLLSLLPLALAACVPTIRTPLKQALPSVLGAGEEVTPCWREAWSVALPGSVRAATLADLDRNGAVDLAAIATVDGASSLVFAFNGGRGDLTRTTSLRLNGTPRAIAAGDLNLDGFVDLMVASGPAIAREPSALHVLLGDGAGGFIAGATPLPFEPSALFAVDLDANDVLDAVVLDAEGQRMMTLVGNGRGELEVRQKIGLPGKLSPATVAFGDFDGDRFTDLATLHDRGGAKATLTLHRGDGDDFRPWMRVEVGRDARAIAAGDINRDGAVDLVALADRSVDGGPPSAVLLLGNGASELDFLGVRYFGPSGAAAAHLVDVNGDGFLDVVAPRLSGDMLDVIPGDRRGGLGKIGSSGMPSGTRELLVGDLDRDGRPELIALSGDRPAASILQPAACEAPPPAATP
ncbi:MAG: VCBS repeat-containing protein [Myxococcales bacterium]|nr:VCBS repeat-containing protein [Myxococcales bacterium]